MGENNVEWGKVRGDLQLRQVRSFQSSKVALEALLRDLRQTRQRAQESIANCRSEMRLQASLERERQRDQCNKAQLEFQDLISTVDTEMENANTLIGKVRHEIVFSLSGFFFGSVAATLGLLRLIF